MNATLVYKIRFLLFILFLFCLSTAQSVWAAEGNVHETDKYAWSENTGWINFRPAHGGVSVYATHLEGYAWGENIGWIKLGSDNGGPYFNTTADNWGVIYDGSGGLFGYAWSETAGWIRFHSYDSQVTIDSDGVFDGYAWSENLGWIHFKDADARYQVRTGFDPGTEGYPDDDGYGCFIRTVTGR